MNDSPIEETPFNSGFQKTTDDQVEGSTLPAYPSSTRNLTSASLEILSTPGKGRGVFASHDIDAGTVIEVSVVLVIGKNEYENGVNQSVLKDYVFTWRGVEGGMAVALGIGSLFNHSSTAANVSFSLSYSNFTITYTTSRSIKKGEELSIFYGHSINFGDDPVVERLEPDMDAWGGLGSIDSGESDTSSQSTHVEEFDEYIFNKLSDEEVLPWDSLPWKRITDIVDPEDLELTTMDCWIIDMPAKSVQIAFEFVRIHSLDFEVLSHLKRVKKSQSTTTLSVLLFPVSNCPPTLPELLASSELADFNCVPYIVPAPAVISRTLVQLTEWSKVWPVSYIPIRVGAKAEPKSLGWVRTKKEWVEREIRKVWKAAGEAEARGEHPIACIVTDSYDPMSHNSTRLPKTLVRSHDTRISTGNVLSHAVSNAIDSVAILDRQGLRDPPLQSHLPFPYLLTGLTVFMTHEPCLLCSMSLLHSRIGQLYFVKSSSGSGGCGSVYSVHEDGGLNHKFDVFQWNGGEMVGDGCDLKLDP